MMRSLYSGVSGLKVHQTKMDVIGNNIANVNTVGFKSSSVTFSDIFYQTTQSATGPNENTGSAGQNAQQIGLGANLASITTSITETGGSQRTDNPFDIMISGDSFFVVNEGGTNYFTKAGSFNVDANGTLCTSSGATVMGWQVDATTGDIITDAVTRLDIMSPDKLYSVPKATTDAYISGNIDQKDTQVIGDGRPVQISFYDKMGTAYTAKLNVKQAIDTATGTAITNQYTVDVTDIVDKSNKSIFTTTNAAGDTVASTISEFSLGAGFDFKATVSATGALTVDPATAGNLPVLSFVAGTGKFDFVGAAGGTSLKLAIDDGTTDNFEDVTIDFAEITMFSTSGSSSLESAMGTTDGVGAGKKVGNMTGVSVDTSGKIYGKYDNGDSILLGQIAVASFSNPSGLESVGGNMFAETQNSGKFDGIGQDVSQGGGGMTTGVLEMSNVDLSAEFTEMITTQRGFQANSRIITTSDTLLEELINLKR